MRHLVFTDRFMKSRSVTENHTVSNVGVNAIVKQPFDRWCFTVFADNIGQGVFLFVFY